MTDIDLLEWMLKARKAGKKTFLVDVQFEGKLLVGASVIFVHSDSVNFQHPHDGQDIKKYDFALFECLSNPRLYEPETYGIKAIAQQLTLHSKRRFCGVGESTIIGLGKDGTVRVRDEKGEFSLGLHPFDLLTTYTEYSE